MSQPERVADTQLTLTRTFNTSAERLFDCFTNPELVARWWGPVGTHCPEATADLRIGGSYRFAIAGNDSGSVNVVTGEYLEIERPGRLVFSWRWEDSPEEITLVTLVIRSLGEHTCELELTHQQFPDQERTQRHSEGWSSSLTCLRELTDQSVHKEVSNAASV